MAEGIRKQRHSSRPAIRRRGLRLCLMGAIDDATSKAMGMEFRPTEDQAGYLRHITLSNGVPQCIFHDKHTILRSPKEVTHENDCARDCRQNDRCA